MKNEFVPYDIALTMKELGFNEKTICYYTDDKKLWQMGIPWTPDNEPIYGLFTPNIGDNVKFVAAPLYQQAFRWFREKHNLKSWIQEHTSDTFIYEIRPHVLSDYKQGETYVYTNYEKVELACLKKLIEIVKGGNK